MLDTGSFFEMYRSQESVTAEAIIREIKSRYPPEKMFAASILVNNDIVKKFRDHLYEMGIENPPLSIVSAGVRRSIKIAHMIYGSIDETEKLQNSLSLINTFLGINPGNSNAANQPPNTAPPPTPSTSTGNQGNTPDIQPVTSTLASTEITNPVPTSSTAIPSTVPETPVSQPPPNNTPMFPFNPNIIQPSPTPVQPSTSPQDIYIGSNPLNVHQHPQFMLNMQQQLREMQQQMINLQYQMQQSMANQLYGNSMIRQSIPPALHTPLFQNPQFNAPPLSLGNQN